MKILFLLGATSRIRNFDHALTILADRGHDIRVAGRPREGSFELPKTVEHPRISGRVNPTQRVDEWREFVDLLRGARDYVRYFDPRYAHATRLVRRAYEIAPTEFVLFCERHPWMKRRWNVAARVLALCEDLIPADPGFEAFLREENPDLVLVTPLVTFESYQTDYVKAANRLGIPVVFIPFSWDNLTNKGLMRVRPDRVLVWNDIQRQEAIDLHGCVPPSVTVTGAARFDDFFSATPSTTREAFLTHIGLDPARPMVLYLGSSQLTGPNEMELVRRWAEALRAADDDRLRTCGILVRPHPAIRASWTSVDLSDLGNVALSLNATRNADQELFDAVFHAHVAVGLNTSAMLEAAIVGRPVHTLVIPGFDQGQVGTIHFTYLVEAYGGLVTTAHSFDEHRRQLAPMLAVEPVISDRSRRFAEQFLRPYGIDRAVSGILADEIERAAAIITRPQARAPLWHYPLRLALRAWMHGRAPRRRPAVDATIIGTSLSLRPVKTALEEIQRSTAPVFIGPWVDSIGNELLYWIPFLRWIAATYALPPERLIVLSRGAVAHWYGSLADRSLDFTALFSEAEIERWMRRTVPQSEQDPKQAVMSPFDREIIERAARSFDLSEYDVLHPFLLFRVWRRLRKDGALERLAEVSRHARLDTAPPRIDRLPTSFVAVSTAFSDAFPVSDDNQRFVTNLLARLATDHELVVVDDVPVEPASRLPHVHSLCGLDGDAAPIELQTRAIAQASAFIGGYGDLAILAAFCGTPVRAFHTRRLPIDHLDRLKAASASGGWAPLSVERTHRFKGVRWPKGRA